MNSVLTRDNKNRPIAVYMLCMPMFDKNYKGGGGGNRLTKVYLGK